MKNQTIKILEKVGIKKGVLNNTMLNSHIEKVSKQYLRRKEVPEEIVQRVFWKITQNMNEIELEAVRSVTLFPDVLESLARSKKMGLKIGIITRSCKKYVEAIVEKFQLQTFVDKIVARDDVLTPKPDPKHAQYLINILEVKASETILIGDSPMDGNCARGAGVKFFLLKRGRKNVNVNTQSKPTEIRDLYEIFDKILSNIYYNEEKILST